MILITVNKDGWPAAYTRTWSLPTKQDCSDYRWLGRYPLKYALLLLTEMIPLAVRSFMHKSFAVPDEGYISGTSFPQRPWVHLLVIWISKRNPNNQSTTPSFLEPRNFDGQDKENLILGRFGTPPC